MIQSIKGKLTKGAMKGEFGKGFPLDQVQRTRALLAALNAATSLDDLRFPPSRNLEPMKGRRKGQHSVRISKQWRICFRWTPTGPEDVEIVDYHS